jgi:hypothetical protein
MGRPCESGRRKGVFLRGRGALGLDLEQLPDLPENYRKWTFRIEPMDSGVILSVTEDNIPDETKRARSDEFWAGVLSTIKGMAEAGT